jgi:hypothetical protein
MLEKLNETELLEIINSKTVSEKINALLDRTELKRDFEIIRDHAFGAFWKKRFKMQNSLSDAEISKILEHKRNHYDVWSLLGEAVKLRKVNPEEAKKLIKNPDITKWARNQIEAFLLISNLTENQTINKIDLLLKLLGLKTYWAIPSLLKEVDKNQMKEFIEVVKKDNNITKSDRAWLLKEMNNK